LNNVITVGCRVIVPFGKAKLYTGIVTSIHEIPPIAYTAKYVEHVLDDHPIVTPHQLTFWRWVANYYMAGIGEVMNAALPSNFKLASETKIVLHPEYDASIQLNDERERHIIEALELNDSLDLKEIAQLVGIQTIQPIIKKLMDKRLVLTQEALNERFTPKTATYVDLNSDVLDEEQLTLCINRLEQKKSAEKHKEENIIRKQLFYNNNKERILQRQKELYESNKEKINATKKAYYEKNKDKINAKSKERYEQKKLLLTVNT
jgi:primosomal protein N' (replication factor Y)